MQWAAASAVWEGSRQLGYEWTKSVGGKLINHLQCRGTKRFKGTTGRSGCNVATGSCQILVRLPTFHCDVQPVLRFSFSAGISLQISAVRGEQTQSTSVMQPLHLPQRSPHNRSNSCSNKTFSVTTLLSHPSQEIHLGCQHFPDLVSMKEKTCIYPCEPVRRLPVLWRAAETLPTAFRSSLWHHYKIKEIKMFCSLFTRVPSVEGRRGAGYENTSPLPLLPLQLHFCKSSKGKCPHLGLSDRHSGGLVPFLHHFLALALYSRNIIYF